MTPTCVTATQLVPTFSSPPPTLPSHHLFTTEIDVASQILGPFQLSAKTATIFHKALQIDKDRQRRSGREPHTSAFMDLDDEIRKTTKVFLQQNLDWETKLDCFAMLVRYDFDWQIISFFPMIVPTL